MFLCFKKINKLTLLLFLLAGFFIFGKVCLADNYYSGSIYFVNDDAVWQAGEVFVLEDDDILLIERDATLTLEPGVIIKLGQEAEIMVWGSLRAIGTADNPVIFTSLADDDAGGDTNGDGDETSPAMGDWDYIDMTGQELIFDYVEIKYGGTDVDSGIAGNVLIHSSGLTSIKHTDFINNAGDIEIDADNFSISYSNFYNDEYCLDYIDYELCGQMMYNRTDTAVSAQNVYWGSADGPSVNEWGENGTFLEGSFLYEPFLTKPWYLDMPDNDNEYQGLDPVIIVPGIMGSWNLGAGWTLDPIFNTYRNLWWALEEAGYEKNKTLFAFPYNWRLANTYTASLLDEKIEEVKNICDCDKVDIIAHSMGGLVTRAYIELLDYDDDIDQLIFLGVPHQGSAKAYLTWEGGEVGPDIRNKIEQRIFQLEAELNGFGSVYKYMQDLPMKSVQELLPIYDYLKDADSNELRNYPSGYPQNGFLELLNEDDLMSKLSDIDITNILADAGDNSTIDAYRVVENVGIDGQWQHGYPDGYNSFFGDHGIEYGAGDSTVSKKSNENFADSEQIIIQSSHNAMVTDAQKQIIKELTGQEPDTEITGLFSKFLMFTMHSPADFYIIDPLGNKLGNDFSGGVYNDIEGGFYTGSNGGAEFAIIGDPLEGEYKIVANGTGSGKYIVKTIYIKDGNELEKSAGGLIESGQRQTFSVKYSSDSLTEATLEANDLSDNYVYRVPKKEPATPVDGAVIINKSGRQMYYTDKKSKRLMIVAPDKLPALVEDDQFEKLTTKDPILPRAGGHIIRLSNSPKLYLTTESNIIHAIDSDLLEKLIGYNWQKKLIALPVAYEQYYVKGRKWQDNMLPNGFLIRYKNTDDVFYIQNGQKRKLVGNAFDLNNLSKKDIITVSIDMYYSQAEEIIGWEKNINLHHI